MRIYRVEDPECVMTGRNGDVYKYTFHWGNLPCPQADGLQKDLDYKKVCGTTNKKDLHSWWKKKDLGGIISTGMRVTVLEVDKKYVDRCGMQCMFTRRKAKVVGHMNAKGEVILEKSAETIINNIRQKGKSTSSRPKQLLKDTSSTVTPRIKVRIDK